MSRSPQPEGRRGSLRWIQLAVNEGWPELNDPIVDFLGGDREIEWLSPLRGDVYAEYRDSAFLDRVGLAHLSPELADFWPARGPQWDALGVTDRGEVLLVEAKAHVAELCSPATAARPASRQIIVSRLATCAERLGARAGHAPWTDHFYQLANRLAHLQFLRDEGIPAFLILVNFLNDTDMQGPTTGEAWSAAYDVAMHVMGLRRHHPLSPYILEVYPDVSRHSQHHPPSKANCLNAMKTAPPRQPLGNA